jgi:hypothetical protein
VEVLDINKPAQIVTIRFSQPASWHTIEYAPAEA